MKLASVTPALTMCLGQSLVLAKLNCAPVSGSLTAFLPLRPESRRRVTIGHEAFSTRAGKPMRY